VGHRVGHGLGHALAQVLYTPVFYLPWALFSYLGNAWKEINVFPFSTQIYTAELILHYGIAPIEMQRPKKVGYP